MDNVLKVILIGAGVIFAMLLVALGYKIFNKGEESVNIALEQTDDFTTQLIESKYTKYDGVTVTGSDVLNCIKSLKGEVICITVNNGKQVTEYLYNSTLTNDLTDNLSDMLKEAKNVSNLNKYINPNAKFEGEIVRDADTDTIIGITFVKK